MVTNGQHLGGVTQSVFVLWLLWLLLALSSYARVEPAPYDVLISGLLVLFFILGLRVPPGISGPVLCLSIFLLANVIAGMCATNPVHTLRSMFIRFYMILSWFLFTCLIYENPRRVYGIIWNGYIFAAIICIVVASLIYFGIIALPPAPGRPEVLYERERAQGLFKDPNVFGPYLVPVALYTLARIIDGSGLRLLVMGGLCGWFFFGILIGFSRGAWLNLGVSLMVAMALRFYTARGLAQYARSFVRAGIVMGVVAFLLIVFMAKSANTIGEMLQARAKLVQYYDTDRFAYQGKTLENALVNPIGKGPGQSQYLDAFGRAPHNLFLHVLIESGWVGAVAFYAFLAMTLWRGLNFCMQPTVVQNAYIIVFACTVGTLTQSVFIDSTHWRHMFLLFGMLWGPLLAWQADRAVFLSLRRSPPQKNPWVNFGSGRAPSA